MSTSSIAVKQLFDRWLSKTMSILEYELTKRGIGITDDLRQSLQDEVTQLADGYVRGEVSFLTRGRMVDMGAGRGYSAGGKRIGTKLTRGQKRRKPNQWYSRAMYGRLNDLMGAVGFTIMEEAIDSIKRPLKAV